MIRLLLFFILLLPAFTKETITVEKDFKVATSQGKSYFIKEDSEHNTPEEILNSKKLNLLQSSTVGFTVGPFWTKMTLHNTSGENKNLLVMSEHPGANYVDAYVYREGELSKTYLLGDLRPQNEREILDRFSLFPLELKAGEEVTIVGKFENYGFYRVGWRIEGSNSFINHTSDEEFLFAFIAGFVFLFVIYATGLFIVHRRVGYLLLAIESGTTTLFLFSVYGMFYQLNIGLDLDLITMWAFVMVYIAAIVRILFIGFFFEMQKRYKKIFYLAIGLSFFCFLMMITTVYAMYIDETIFKIISLQFFFFAINPYIWIIVGFFMWRRKELGSVYFLLGQGLLATFATIHTAAVFGYAEFHWYTQYLISIALVIDALFMVALQSYRRKVEMQKYEKEKQMLIEQSRFFTVGQAISNIVHQYKVPLTKLGTSVTMLEGTVKMNSSNLENMLKEELPSLKFSIGLMRDTLGEFSNFYSQRPEKREFHPKQVLEQGVIPLVQSKITLDNACIKLDIPIDLTIENYEHIFSNIMMILINNSLEAFEQNSSKTNTIAIAIEKVQKKIKIVHSDNAGGIKIEPVEKIFDYYVTSKKEESNSGVGLAMAKILIEEQCGGKISAHNTEEGACFTILMETV